LLGLLNPYIAIYFRKEGLPFSILFLIFLANYLGNIFQPFWGALSDRLDARKPFLILGALIWMIAMLVINAFPVFIVFLLFFGIASLFGSASQPVARSLVSLITIDEEETEYQSKFGVLLTTAFSISAWAGGLILSQFNFNLLFTITVFLSILSFFLIFPIKEHQLNKKNLSSQFQEKDRKRPKDIGIRTRLMQLLKNKLYFLIVLCSCFGGFAFYFFLNFFSVFYVENGGSLTHYSWALVISFILFMTLNYSGEAIIKRKNKSFQKLASSSSSSKNDDNVHLDLNIGDSERLKAIFVLWSIIGFSVFCFLLVLYPIIPLFAILLMYSFPIVPFFFTSMLALTAKVVEPEKKALAIGLQGVFVFGGRSLAVFLGSLVLDTGGFGLAALIDLFLLVSLFLIVAYSFKRINVF
jgi:MFS family permease